MNPVSSAEKAAEKPAAARRPRRWVAWLSLFLLVVGMFALIAIPVALIMPFKSQTPRALDVAFNLKRWSPMVTIAGGIIALALAVHLWPRSRWYKRTLLVLFLGVTGVVAWFARQNHFEWMFNPLPNPTYAAASEVSYVNDTDQVLAVQMNDEAVAYPIREMA